MGHRLTWSQAMCCRSALVSRTLRHYRFTHYLRQDCDPLASNAPPSPRLIQPNHTPASRPIHTSPAISAIRVSAIIPSTAITTPINNRVSRGTAGQNGTGNAICLRCCALRPRRMAKCESRIITHTQTVAKAAREAISTNTRSGIR